jgi:hypothetical protein
MVKVFQIKDSSYEFIILYYIIYWVPITNWNVNQYKFFHFMMVQSNDQSNFFDLKSPLLLTNEFF